jgi:prepilin-type N-terminal cleavage/methylation domain-containing protein
MNASISPKLVSRDDARIPRRSADFQSAVSQASSLLTDRTVPEPCGLEIRDTAYWKFALRARGFTLIELLVVLALVALWVLMLAPGFAHTQPNSRTAQCLSNKRQVALACGMYTGDWNDYLVPNAPAGDYRGWCNGQEGWGAQGPNTNRDYYTTNCLAPYVGFQIRVYKCPGDTIPSDNGDRIRSISMNGMMIGGGAPVANNSYNPGWRIYKKYTDLTAPAPAMAWIFCDESMYTLNDGFLQMGLNSSDYPDIPAAYHGGINCFTFGDGHVEPHQWRYQGTPSIGILNCPYRKDLRGTRWPSSGSDVDYLWLKARTSVPQ